MQLPASGKSKLGHKFLQGQRLQTDATRTHRSLCTRTPYLSLAVRLGIAMPLEPLRLSSERPVNSTWSPTRMHSFDLSAIAMPWLSGRTSRLQGRTATWPPFDKSTPSRPERRHGVTVPVCPFIPAVLRPLRTTCSTVPYADFWTCGRTRLWSQMSCFTSPRPEEIQSTCKSSKPACCANTFIACSSNSSSKPLSLVRTSTTRAHELEADCDIWSEKRRWRARQISTRGPSAGMSQDPCPAWAVTAEKSTTWAWHALMQGHCEMKWHPCLPHKPMP